MVAALLTVNISRYELAKMSISIALRCPRNTLALFEGGKMDGKAALNEV